MSQSSPPLFDLNGDQEISLMDILRFLKSAWKTTAISGVAGIALSIAYLAIAPKQYEAIAQIIMAQLSTTNNNPNPLGVNIEEPALLVSRMSLPTSFTPQTMAACGLADISNSGATLAKGIKLAPAKGVANVVELKTFGPSQEVALSCANAIFELIKTTQSQILTPYIEEAKIKLADDEVRLAKAKDLVARADKSGSVMSAAYLSTRDEIRYLLDEITALKNVVTSNQNRMTHLVAPIYASDLPSSSKKRMALAGGLFGGLFLGLLIALARQMIKKIKSKSGGVL
jgi:LPS O-antigen subunit length determinant protein (WzzB/FepE family)